MAMNFKIFKYSDYSEVNDSTAKSVKTFGKQSDAIRFSEKNNLPVFSFEIDNHGRRRFMSCSLEDFWTFYSKMKSEQRVHYEVIVSQHRSKLYFDLEFLFELNSYKDGNRMTLTFIEIINRELKKEYQIESTVKDCLILESSNTKKFSIHLIFYRVIFVNNEVILNFLNKVISSFSVDESLMFEVFDKHGKVSLFVDRQVYTKNRHFRCFLSSKYGAKRPLFLSHLDSSTADLPRTEVDKEVFNRSIITNVDDDNVTSILGCREEKKKNSNTSTKDGKKECLAPDVSNDMGHEFQRVIEVVKNIVHPSGNVRKTFFSEKVIRFEIANNKFCFKANRCHSRNNIFFKYIRSSGIIYQECYSLKCCKLPNKTFFI